MLKTSSAKRLSYLKVCVKWFFIEIFRFVFSEKADIQIDPVSYFSGCPMRKFLLFLFFAFFLVFAADLKAWESLTCKKCSESYGFKRLIGKPFKRCLNKVDLTKENCFASTYRIMWDEMEWDSAFFIRTAIPDYDWDDEYREDIYHIFRPGDYRFAISQVYADLNLLWKSSKSRCLKKINSIQKLISKYEQDLERSKKDLVTIKNKLEKKECLDEIEFCKEAIISRQEEIEEFRKYIKNDKDKFLRKQKIAQKTEIEMNKCFLKQYDWCWQQHHHVGALYERGMLYFSLGQTLKALEDIGQLIETARKEGAEEELKRLLFQAGQCQSELGLYQEAIFSLTELLQMDPENKEAYFERAVAFFETGDIEASLSDYLASDIKPKPLDKTCLEKLDFALGLSAGVFKGSCESAVDFIPSLLSAMKGLGEALWVFAESPIQVSTDLAQGVVACVEYAIKSSLLDLTTTVVPELKDLIGSWDQLDSYQQGEMAGNIIGKYGLEIYLSKKMIEGVKIFRDLRRANSLLTFEAAAASRANRVSLMAQATKRIEARKKILQSANLKINRAKQGKHIMGHPNFNTKMNPSILLHPDPQKLTTQFAGKGFREGTVLPGQPGYKEVVDFGEFIGYSVNKDTGERLATTWGKIHYAKDGVHIVPTTPRSLPPRN